MIISSVVAAAGTVLSAYVLKVARETRTSVNGTVDLLASRLALLEQRFSAQVSGVYWPHGSEAEYSNREPLDDTGD